MIKALFVLLVFLFFVSCSIHEEHKNYESILRMANLTTSPIELVSDNGQARIIVVPKFQGRVLTSTNTGLKGKSLGWINPDILESNSELNGSEIHGEERVWIGPLGSQHSFYYGRKQPINEDNWEVPESFNAVPFELMHQTTSSVLMSKKIELTNFSGTHFTMNLEREITLLNEKEVQTELQVKIPKEVSVVAYSTRHFLQNTDSISWTKETGLATIWSLSTFKGTDKTITIIPLKQNADESKIFQYLNNLPENIISIKNNVLRYKTDGKFRSKIGVPPELSKGILASYSPETQILRIVKFHQNENDSLYFNSAVLVQENPYKGEAIAVYNHGPMDLSFGSENQFFEMESAAAFKELNPGETLQHQHTVFQFTGSTEQLNEIARVGLNMR